MSDEYSKEGYVLIIGSSNMDLNVYSKRLPRPGETVTGGTFQQFLGGKGANQAVASVRSGSKTIFIAKIGQDTFGDQMISSLTKEGIDALEIGQVLKVEADDPAAEEDIKRWAKRTGHELLKFEKKENLLVFYIKKMKKIKE